MSGDRGPSGPGPVLQDRDLLVLRGLFESRVMTTEQIATLFFEGHKEAAKKRLQKLKGSGIIRERPRRPYEPAVLFLTKAGFNVVSDTGILQSYPKLARATLEKRSRISEMTLRHELEVIAVKSALTAAINRQPSLCLIEFSTWPLLNQFYARRSLVEQSSARSRDVLVRPDGFIRVGEENEGGKFEHTFYLELDRSTEPQETLARRAAYYLYHYQSGGLATKHGMPRDAYKEFPFRVLMVFRNAERRNNTAERILQGNPPVLTLVWLTTLSEVVNDPLGAIWIRPLDYRQVTTGTRFDPERRRQIRVYRRDPDREAAVESSVGKHHLIVAPFKAT